MSLEKRVKELEVELQAFKRQFTQLPFTLHDNEGNKRCEISADSKGASLKFYNAKDKPALSLGVDGTDSGFVTIQNAEGKAVVKLDVESYGARLELLDSYWGSNGAVVMHGNDCDNEGGWIKILSGSDEQSLFINAAGVEENE